MNLKIIQNTIISIKPRSIFFILMLLFSLSKLFSAPQVNNLFASQRNDSSKKVDVYFDLSHNLPVTVSIYASQDNGITWNMPINLVSGDAGPNISPGNGKHIVWDVLAEHPNVIYDNVKFKVVADDGQIPEGFVFVHSGEFTMGDTHGGGEADEVPTHIVTLSAFYISACEVTQAEWLSIMGSNPSQYVGDILRPVEKVSWYDCIVYCNKRSIAEGKTPAYSINSSTNPDDWGTIPTTNNSTWNSAICNWFADGYRLPTEAEWEYAARGASMVPDYLYSGSDDVNSVAWYISNSGGTPHPVGLKQANSLGIFDMSGNVYEWCWDRYGYYNSSSQINPLGPNAGNYRVARGHSFVDVPFHLRIPDRNQNMYPSVREHNLGLRLVLSN
ncbi:MAG: Serine/threonine-protein kinase pkn1 [Candidatus Cloacimonetes bacterium ADurb.Bin088]|jgi:sulfatase modifying factor 1|nr:MAG: Serine/threonine-protein kinase pkn1 [Candidatus Cloacimonetes bacterium ADurb.Bin088]